MIADYIAVDGALKDVSEISFVESFWTGMFSKYGEHVHEKELARRSEYRLMKPYLEALPAGARILDGGCGRGEWTVFLSKLGYRVTGLDISEQMISRLCCLFPRYSFERGDLRRTSFPDGTFDAYFSWGAFEHFEVGLGPCLYEAHRLLKPGGLLFLSVPFENRRQQQIRSRAGAVTQPSSGERFYQWRFTMEDLNADLISHGFEVLDIAPIHKLHGLQRMLKQDFHIILSSFPRIEYVCLRMMGLVVSANYVSHMLIGVAHRNAGEFAKP